jgi:hypothetical protein
MFLAVATLVSFGLVMGGMWLAGQLLAKLI